MTQKHQKTLRSTRFRKDREHIWQELEQLVLRVDTHGLKTLSAEEIERLPHLYRATLSSLNTAKTISHDKSLIQYLTTLSTRGYHVVYGTRLNIGQAIVDFFTVMFPQSVRDLGRYLAFSSGIFFAGMAVAWFMVLRDPTFYFAFVAESMASGRDPNATTESLRSALFDGGDSDSSSLAMFASFLASHNAKIGMMAFGLGFAGGVPTVYLLFQNGLVLGAFSGLYHSRDLTFELYSWLLPHGVTEILAVLLCGAAGLYIGKAAVFCEENLSRMDSIVAAGKRVGPTVIGAVVMFFLASLIEGFFRQWVQSIPVRYGVAMVTALFWIFYFVTVGRDERVDGAEHV